MNVDINFAYRTFKCDSESTQKAKVHCVIIGFATFSREQKIIFDGDDKIFAKNINAYLQDAPNFFLKNRTKPIQKNTPLMFFGNMPADNNNFSLTEDEKNLLLKKYPDAEKFVKKFLGSREFLHNEKRFCLWLIAAEPSDIKKITPIFDRVKKVREFRLNSSFKKIANRSHEFRDLKNPKKFLLVPRVSGERRKYIPMDFFDENFIATDSTLIIPDADLYLFGILQSSVHMAWAKNVCGYLGISFRYSKGIVYNNFPFPEVSENQRKKIEHTAQLILDARKNYPRSSLADLYDLTATESMCKDLCDAHEENDRAVMEAYGFDKKLPENLSDAEILQKLIVLYKNLTSAK